MKSLNRRKFLKTAAVGAFSSSVTPGFSWGEQPKLGPYESNPRSTKKIIVAGAGIAGLCCGYELMKKGHEVVVLEASGRPVVMYSPGEMVFPTACTPTLGRSILRSRGTTNIGPTPRNLTLPFCPIPEGKTW